MPRAKSGWVRTTLHLDPVILARLMALSMAKTKKSRADMIRSALELYVETFEEAH